MSKRPSTASSKGAIPKQVSKSSIGKPQKGKGKPGTSTGTKGKKDPKQDAIEWQLPAFSVPPQKKKEINWELLRKETARRHSPDGEDIKEIRRIMKELKGVDIPVHEFINMVSPYTSDNGTALRSVMAEDLESFRSLAKKVYETMTQDVSDVLVNEQLQMVQYYEEKTNHLSEKMMRSINDIYEMAPNFEFDRFLRDKEDYLTFLFPMPRDAEVMNDEACEMVRRQQAYHRLQWLKSEGERMSEENKRLMRRLEELKREQQTEQNRAAEQAAEAETKRQELAQEENDMKDKLEKLNESIEKSFIRDEANITKEHNISAMEPPSETTLAEKGPKGKATGAIRKTRSGAGLKKPRAKAEWSSETAADIEEGTIKATATAETRRYTSRPAFKKPKGARAKSPHFSPIKTPPSKPPPKQASPFHYSPPKSPRADMGASAQPPEESFVSWGKARPKKGAKPPSPFHYSPPRSPPAATSTQMGEQAFSSFGSSRPQPSARQTSPFHYSPPRVSPPAPPQVQETRIEESKTTVQQKRPQPRVRQGQAPRDTWGGFY